MMDNLLQKWRNLILEKGNLNFNQFKTIKDKVLYIINCDTIAKHSKHSLREELDHFVDCVSSKGTKKCIEKAILLKKEGVKIYVNKRTTEALRKFSDALRYAPSGYDIIPLLYGNRSAALFRLELYSECINDISRALHFDCPELKPKLLIRRTKCYIELNKRLKASEDLNYLLNSEQEILQKYDKDILDLKEQIKQLDEVNESTVEEIDFPLHGGQSLDLPQMSSALELRENEKYGRHIIAKEDIKSGCTLFVEDAFAGILIKENFYTYCSNCLNFAWNPIMCDDCIDVVWCDEKCREKGKRFHRYECNFLQVLVSVGLGYLSLRTVTEVGWDTCMKSEERCSSPNKYPFNNAYDNFASLLSHFEDCAEMDQLFYCQAGFIIALILLRKTDFAPIEERNCEKKLVGLAAILAENVNRLACNAYTISEVQNNPDTAHVADSFNCKKVAAGIFVTTSLLNHSCEPSVISIFLGKTIILRSTKDIEAGSQIYNSYGPCSSLKSRSSRQNYLKRHYFFECDCEDCRDDSSDLNEANLAGVQCPKCKGIAIWNDEQFSSLSCISCSMLFEPPPASILEKCSTVNSLYEEGIKLLSKKAFDAAEVKLTQALSGGNLTFSEGNLFLGQIRSDCARALILKENLTASLEMFIQCYKFAIRRYGKYSFQCCLYLLGYLVIIDASLAKNKPNHTEFTTILKYIEQILLISFGSDWRKLLDFSKLKLRRIM